MWRCCHPLARVLPDGPLQHFPCPGEDARTPRDAGEEVSIFSHFMTQGRLHGSDVTAVLSWKEKLHLSTRLY